MFLKPNGLYVFKVLLHIFIFCLTVPLTVSINDIINEGRTSCLVYTVNSNVNPNVNLLTVVSPLTSGLGA